MTRIVSSSAVVALAAAIATLGLGCSTEDSPGGTGGSAGSGAMAGSGGTTGAAGSGGMAGAGGGSTGTGGTGGAPVACDDFGGRPVLTAQPTVTPMDPGAGDTVQVNFAVSSDTRYVRVVFAAPLTPELGGEEIIMTDTGGPLMAEIELTNDPSTFVYVLGFLLCNEDNLDCFPSTPTTDSVSYGTEEQADPAGTPYRVNVRDDGASNPGASGDSCYDVVAFRIPAP